MSEENVRSVGNEIYFYGEVNEQSALELNTMLRRMERQCFSHLVLYIHSTGGDAYAAFSIMDHIDALDVPVHTVVDGLCCSAATLILLAGKRRRMKKHARLMIHQVSSANDASKHSDIKDEMRHLDGLMQQMKKIYLERTGISHKRLRNMMRRDIYINVDQCLKYGIIDSIF
jgi:ATP-dependent Clp endopeptidase proteolytic subunit ClpP